MKRLAMLLVTCFFLGACGGGGGGSSSTPAAAPSVDVTGIWTGTLTSSVSGTVTATLKVTQTGASVTGNYISSNGAFGNVSGTVSGNTLSFKITPSQAGCTGDLSGSGVATTPSSGQPTMSFNYSGSTSCGGPETGTGNLTKQPTTSSTIDITGTWSGIVTSSVAGTRAATLNVTQTGTNVTGNYSASGGVMGNVSGTISGNTLSFTITPTQAGCTGTLSGTGVVITPSSGQPTMTFNYIGSTSCGGPETGTGNLTKQ